MLIVQFMKDAKIYYLTYARAYTKRESRERFERDYLKSKERKKDTYVRNSEKQ